MKTFAKLAWRQYKEDGVQVRGTRGSHHEPARAPQAYHPLVRNGWREHRLSHSQSCWNKHPPPAPIIQAALSQHPALPLHAEKWLSIGESVENVRLAEAELSGTKHGHFPTPGRTTQLSGESQYYLSESKPSRGWGSCLGNSARPKEMTASVMV